MGRSEEKGRLYLIPIELGDVEVERYQPPRTMELLARLRYYVVENARTARRYLSRAVPRLDISSITLYELDKHHGYAYPNEEVLELLNGGEDVGVMSEAGCPGVADPGHRVVTDCHHAEIDVYKRQSYHTRALLRTFGGTHPRLPRSLATLAMPSNVTAPIPLAGTL